MVYILSGTGLVIGVFVVVTLLAKLIGSGKGGYVVQTEIFTSMTSVFSVAALAFGAALIWVGTHEYVAKLLIVTLITIAAFSAISILANLLISKARRSGAAAKDAMLTS